MPSYPMYQPDRSFFPSNNNVPHPNLNIHVGLPQSPHQPIQQNASLSFLSSPPPNLAASQHVFHGGQGFTVMNGSNAPPAFTSSVAALVSRPPPPITPDIKPFQNMTTQWNAVPAISNTRPQSSMPNVHDFKNSNFTANSCNGLNQVSLGIPNDPSSKFHFGNGNASQTQPQFSESRINPWAQVLPPSTSNFHNIPGNTMQSSNDSGHFNRNASQTQPQFSESSINPWSQVFPPSASNFHNIPGNAMQSSNNSEHLNASASLTQPQFSESSTNPWAQVLPPSTNNFHNIPGNTMQSSNNSEHLNADVWFDARGKPDNSKPFWRENFKSSFSGMQPANINPWAVNFNSSQNNSQVEHASSNCNWRKQNAPTYNMKSRHPNEASSEFKYSSDRKNQPNWKRAKFTEKNFNENKSTFHSPRGSGNFHSGKNMYQERFNGNFKTKNYDERPKPYACDTCDRAFSTEADFQYHVSEHIKCNAGNCQFEAHPKIVALHKRMQHDTGYADAISKLKDSEEIAKWRAERKRRFPTAENIRKRIAEQAEKEARGEVIENKEFGKFKKRKFDRNGADNKRFGADSRNRRSRHSNSRRKGNTLNSVTTITSVTVDSDTDSDDDSHIKLPRFPGTSSLNETNLSDISHDNHESGLAVAATQEVNRSKEITLSSSDEADCCVQINNEVNENKPSLQSDDKIEKATEVPKNISELNYINSDDEAPTEMPISKTPVSKICDLSKASEKNASPGGPSERNVSASQDNNISTVNDDSDDAPIEIPINKVPLSETPDFPNEIEKTSSSEMAGGRQVSASQDNNISTINDIDSDDAPMEIPINKVPLSETPDVPNEMEKTSSSEIAGDRQAGKPTKRFSKKEQKELSNNKQKDADYDNTVRKSTLLEKLLADDIRRERNVIMQCIRHVVKKEFFGIGQ